MAKLDTLTLRGFRSIKSLEKLELGQLNVLIGANGAGKSNFVGFFRLLRAMVEQRLQAYVTKNGPADGYFFDGIKQTGRIEADLVFGQNRYAFALEPTAEGLMIANEQTQYTGGQGLAALRQIGGGVPESRLHDVRNNSGLTAQHGPNWYVWNAVSSWQVYQFHDTSMTAGMRRDVGVEQFEQLEPSGENLAAFLFHLQKMKPDRYELLRATIQRVAPFFDDFHLRMTKGNNQDQVRLTWKQKGKSYIFSPGHLSDGTIRFICLATALLQPRPPTTIVLDEPELGLHPEAITILGGLLRSASSSQTQIIVATQSPQLLNEFEPSQVITVDQIDGATELRKPTPESLAVWLEDYSLGELWQKGTLHGGINNA